MALKVDIVTALDYIRRIADLTGTNSWTDKAAYRNFANALRGTTRDWLFSVTDNGYAIQ